MKEKVFCGHHQASDAVYGLGVIGAIVYFWLTSATLGLKLFGILKALVWPAILVFHLLKFLGIN